MAVAHGILSGLDDTREVDHINGDKLDNRPGNLQALTKEQHIDKTMKDQGKSRKIQGTGICADCGAPITRYAKKCVPCTSQSNIFKAKSLTKEDIESLVLYEFGSWIKAANSVGLSDNGLRKRYRSLGGNPKELKRLKKN